MITIEYKTIKGRYTIAILVDGIIRHQYFFVVNQYEAAKSDVVYRALDLRHILGTSRPRLNRSLSMYPVPGSSITYRTYTQAGIYRRIY